MYGIAEKEYKPSLGFWSQGNEYRLPKYMIVSESNDNISSCQSK
jgi:CRISPR/Cas system CSM-associated protein Csm4 (group 5 of RAMP superfamily)